MIASERKAVTRAALIRAFKAVPLEAPDFRGRHQSATPEAPGEEERAARKEMPDTLTFP